MSREHSSGKSIRTRGYGDLLGEGGSRDIPLLQRRDTKWAGTDTKLGVRLIRYHLVKEGRGGGWALSDAVFESRRAQGGSEDWLLRGAF
jgi:hypothetical protein